MNGSMTSRDSSKFCQLPRPTPWTPPAPPDTLAASMRAALLLLLLAVTGCGSAPAAPTAGLSVPDCDLGGLVGALGSEDARVRQDASARLRARGEAALPELEKAKGGKDASLAAQARRLSERIEQDLTDREREADDRAVQAGLPAAAPGTWLLVANGRLAATGPSEKSVREAAPGARHRYLWRSGEAVKDSRAELGSLRAGDFGRAVLEALGRSPRVGLQGREDWAVLDGATPQDWPEAAAALSAGDVRRIGLCRFEIPGTVAVRSRVGAGILARARRARALARSADGSKSLDVTVWILED